MPAYRRRKLKCLRVRLKQTSAMKGLAPKELLMKRDAARAGA
jgi:hypothetical protein